MSDALSVLRTQRVWASSLKFFGRVSRDSDDGAGVGDNDTNTHLFSA